MRRAWMVCLFLLGCGGDDESTASDVDRLLGRFRTCGLLTQSGNASAEAFAGESDLERCAVGCLLEAECADLEAFLCEDYESFTPESVVLAQCFDGCFGEPFACGDGATVPASFVCDGLDDCSGGEDELDCEGFTCDDGQVIPADFQCDGEPDCADGSDETGCGGELFECGDGSSVPRAWVCDLEADCPDGSDEEQACARPLCGA